MSNAWITAVIVLCLGSPVAGATDWVSDALTWGAAKQDLRLYESKPIWYSTPSLRVAMFAGQAAREQRKVDEADVPAALRAAELHIHVPMLSLNTSTGFRMMGASAARLKLPGSDSFVEAARTQVMASDQALGLTQIRGRELLAVFPMSALPTGKAKLEVDYMVHQPDGSLGEPIKRTHTVDFRKGRW